MLYLKPQLVPNLPIGIDEHSEVDMEWKSVSLHNYDQSHNHQACNVKCEKSLEAQQGTRLLQGW